jgi:hypothetical protein
MLDDEMREHRSAIERVESRDRIRATVDAALEGAIRAEHGSIAASRKLGSFNEPTLEEVESNYRWFRQRGE